MRPKKINFQRIYSKTIPKNSYLTHGIHSYTAKLIPQIPRYFIDNYTQEEDVVVDPFCGSGTSLLEARILGRNAIGLDINPLATLISEVKATPLEEEDLGSAISIIKEGVNKNNGSIRVEFPNIDYWFSQEAQNELASIKYNIENLNGDFTEEIHSFLLVCFSSIIRKSSFADPRMAKTYKSKRVIEKIQSGWEPTPINNFKEALDKNSNMIKSLSDHLNSNNNNVKTFQGDARNTSSLLKENGCEKVDLIITSPPYINAQDYFRSYKLELWWLGLATPDEVLNLKRKAIGTENTSGSDVNTKPKSRDKILQAILNKLWKNDKFKSYIVHNYFENMNHTLNVFYKSLEFGGHLCLITGNNIICEIPIPTNQILNRMAKSTGFEQVEITKDEIRNRTLPPGRNHNGGIIKEEWITVFEKAG